MIALIMLLLIIISLLSGCANLNSGSESIVYCDDDKHTSYPDVAAQILPDYTVDITGNRAFYYLEKGAVTEAFDTQAVSALDAGIAKYRYPQYLATVIIAVDRDRTDAIVGSWSDLVSVREEVGVSSSFGSNPHVNNNMIMAAISYGLEGENYTLKKATALLAGLYAENRLARNLFDSPIAICYDFQAADLIKSGRNIEIIVPGEGTLTYEKGLLSNTELVFGSGVNDMLLANGFRLPDGRSDYALYPDAAAYSNAARVTDYEHFSTVSQDATVTIRQDILRIRLLASKDDRQHQYFGLIYLIVVVVWLASVANRAAQKSVRSAALLTGVILICWMAVRIIRLQLPIANDLTRYMRYSYSVFELALPLIALWLAWAIDRPDDNSPPNWLRVLAVFNGVLAILVMTNDFHNFIWEYDFSSPIWSLDYNFGFGHTLTQIAFYLPMFAAITILLIKSVHSPRKKGRVLPIAFIVLLGFYSYGYSAQIPLSRDGDITIITGLFTLLFFEAAMRTGMIPINTRYPVLFTHSPLSMQIADNNGNTVLASAAVLPKDDENTLHLTAQIPGGTVLWQEDMTTLNLLHAEVEESVRKLAAANAMLAGEEKIKRAIAEEAEKTRLMTELETEISGHAVRLSSMVEQIGSTVAQPKDATGQQKDTVILCLLLCYIKRLSALFFREREAGTLPVDVLAVYLNELAGIAVHADVKTILTSEIKKPISVRKAKLFYHFFYNAVDWAVNGRCPSIIAYLRMEGGGGISMRLLPSADARTFTTDTELSSAIASAGGFITLTDYDDAFGLCLSFPEGGESQ